MLNYKMICFAFIVVTGASIWNGGLANGEIITGADEMEVLNPDKMNGTFKAHTTFVGFSAWKGSVQAVAEGDTVIFDGIILNEGNLYQPTLSRFLCDQSGVYFVSLTVQKNNYGDIYVAVLMGSEQVFYLREYEDANPNNIVSNNAVVFCNEGDYISVEATGTGSVFGEPGSPRSMFTVFRLNQQDEAFQQLHLITNGFTAYTTSTQYLNSGDIVQFQGIISNIGTSYFPSTSRYVCPANGTYLVTLTLWKRGDTPIHAGVQKSSITILHIDDAWTENGLNYVSNSRLLQCTAGEVVSVQATGTGSVDGSDRHSTFTMLLLHTPDALGRKHDVSIGFTAWKKVDQTYEVGNTIEFDGILLNEGDFYEPLLNHFVCRVSGIYYVMVNFQKLNTEPLQLDVVKETVPFLRSIEVETENPGNTVSNSGLIRCFAGETIQVKAFGSGSVNGDVTKALTTFSAVLMYQL